MKFLAAFILIISSISHALAANPSINKTFKYYDIKGKTVRQLEAQMEKKGINGYWGYAKWNVKWSANCKVTVSIKITMPRWKNKLQASSKLQNKWKKMISAMKKHELNHAQHGINAGKELVSKNCKKGYKIIDKWAEQDKIYDRKTKNGMKEGIRL